MYNAFHVDPNAVMIVEHLASARTRSHALELEKQHIGRERKRGGNKILNVHHTRTKKK